MIGSTCAQVLPQKSDEQRSQDIEPEEKAPGRLGQKHEKKKEPVKGGMPELENMKDDRLAVAVFCFLPGESLKVTA